MECDEEEDANSLLSLSQTFLQPDSSSSSIGLSTNQIHNWSTLTSTATDVAAQFSPISPADGYNTNTSSSQALMDNETNFRFYGSRSVTNQSATRGGISNLFSRPGNSGISSVSISNSFPTANRVGSSEFCHNSGQVGIDTNTNLCYEQTCNLRPGGNLYGDKDGGYSNRSGFNSNSNTHTIDDSNVITASFAHTGYNDDHNMLSLTSPSDDDVKLGNRNVHLNQKMFDSRSKQDYSKDFSTLYDQSTEKPLQSTEITMSFERRDASNFDGSFEFSSDSRDFTSARIDVASVTRAVQDQTYHQSQKYSSTQVVDGDMLTNTLSLDSKRVSSSYVNFGLSGHVDDGYGRLNNPQKKSAFPHQLNDLPSDLEPVFHGYHTDFGGHQKLLLDNHRNFGSNEFQDNEEAGRFNLKDQASSRDINNKWSGRPRAHRKMARLLGSEEHRDYSQVTDANNSQKHSFTKAMSSLEPVTQDKNSFQQSAQRDLTTSTRTFLTMEEELDLRTNHHQQRSFVTRRDESLDRNQNSQRDFGILQTTSTFSFDSTAMTPSMHKDTASTILASQQFLPTAQLDLDFHATLSVSQSQKDLDLNQHFGLQVSKDFGLETSHSTSNQDDLSFDHSGDPQQVNQPDLTLPDNLGIVSQVQSELSFDAYFNSASERDFTSASDRDFNSTSERDLIFCKKFSSSTSRDLNYVPNATVNDFNIEDYMNPQRDLSQSYFNRPDLPQDMTIYQKTSIDKTSIQDTSNSFKGREKCQNLSTDKDKQGEISELQKELTKTSTKESMKGIRIPRDINRAMEILQGLQEDEREEERRKKQQQHQQLQGLVSSPKKTFQNKHNIESLSLTDQQFMGSSGNFLEDQSVGSFLDHSHLTMSEQPQDGLQMVHSYQPFTQISQPIEVDMVSTLSGKRDLQQNLSHNMTSDLDYHILKRLACSTSIKSITKSHGSSFSNNSANLASILAENSTHDPGIQFPVSGIHFQAQQSDLEDVMSNSILTNTSNSTLELNNRSKNEMTLMDFEPQQPQHIDSEKLQTSNVAVDPHLHPSMEISQVIRCKKEAEVLILSRKNLYEMMKQGQFCDAVLSTSKQTVKVHQVVLCSMSQYLTTLLHKMKQPASTYTAKSTMSSSTCYSSQATRNHSVLLVVNCDGIKSSSMMTFLLYIYLGRAELSESNVLDMYSLACSLRVQTLKDLCKEFMWQAHIPNEQLKVPQLLVSSQRLETQDQATMTEMSTEDKSTNTPHTVRRMEVATQTDRSTSEAGGGGQEEWVMLKKTKQKTVSPSKSRLIGKSLTCMDSPISCKTGKKGWLSPKRRYKTENQVDGKTTEKETAVNNKEILNSLPTAPLNPNSENNCHSDAQNPCSYSNIPETETKGNIHELLTHNTETGEQVSFSINKHSLTSSKKSARTTVEIAAAAAAAKLASHSYGTRTARGIVKIPISYASLASGLEKKKVVINPKEKTVLTMSKKKDFIKSNPETDFCYQSETGSLPKTDNFDFVLKDSFHEPNSITPGSVVSGTASENPCEPVEQLKESADVFKSKVKQPFKKSIVHRSRSEGVLNKSYAQLVSSLPTRADVNAGSENDFMDSYLIDSIVNTMKCDSAEVDLQKVINDLDTLSKSPLLTTASSSVSSTSLTSPLKSPTTLLSTPDSSSPLKSRTTPQGFRKRLIHQINSEKNVTTSPQNITSHDNLPTTIAKLPNDFAAVPLSSAGTVPISVSLTESLSLISATIPLTMSVTTSSEMAFQNMSTCDKLPTNSKINSLPASSSESDKGQLPSQFTESVDELALSLYSLGEETGLVLDSKACSFSSMTDMDLGLKDDPGQQFFHKIFKRKRRPKARKPTSADSDIKVKAKKLQASDAEGGVAKPRLRKAIGSDSEGGASRSKQKKNVFSENEGAWAKVRPPPKKRAKMELELLQAGDSEKHRDIKEDSSKSEVDEINESKSDRAAESTEISECRSKVNLSASDEIKESSVSDGQETVEKPSEAMKTKFQRSGKQQSDATQCVDFQMETKLTVMLKKLTETMNLTTKQYSCKLCQTKFRRGNRVIKHMRSHGLTQEDALQNIAIGEKESSQEVRYEACEICGYRTKDPNYHYMHIHKYFKHGVPLPLGWSTDKCELCGKECFNKFQLKEHMMSHDDNHCFICWHCGQSFKMRNGLNSHIFHMHCNIRKHQCKVCEKNFKTWTQLKVHVRSHTGERPFTCLECGHRSTTQGNMRLHLSIHGYSKEMIQELMEQISKNVQEMDAEALDKVMLSIAEKAKSEQTTVKEKISKKKSSKKKTDAGAQADGTSPTKDIPQDGSSRKNKTENNSKKPKTAVSRFAGSQIERLLTQPLSELKPPKFIITQPSQPSVINMGNSLSSNEESSHSQMFCDSTDTGLGALSLLLQQQSQKQDTSGLSNGMFFIPLPQTDNQQQLQAANSISSMLGYTVIPTHVLPGRNSAEVSLDPSTYLNLPVFTMSDVLSSGLNLVQSGSVQLVDSVFPSDVVSSGMQNTQEIEPPHFLDYPQGHEVVQVSSVTNLQYPDSKILVTDSTKQELNADAFQTLISASNATNGTTTIMVLPNVTSIAPQSQQLHPQVPTIFSYPPLISSSQSVLLPVPPDSQVTQSSLDTNNFVNFSVTVSAPEEVVTLDISQENIDNVTGEAESILIESHCDAADASVNVVTDDGDNNSGLVSYAVVKCENDSSTKIDVQIMNAEPSVCVGNISSIS